MKTIILLFSFCSFLFSYPKTVTKSNPKIIVLQKSNLKVIIDAENAGKIISLQYHNHEYLTGPDTHPLNFGSTLWPAPQSTWNWPPPPILDSKPYQVISTRETAKLISEKDTVITGLQFAKEYHLEDTNTLIIRYAIKNISDSTQKTAAWEITRTNGGISFFQTDSIGIMQNSTLSDYYIKHNHVWYVYNADRFQGGKKLFAGAKGGWLANTNGQILFVKEFPDLVNGAQAPGQGEVEIYASASPPYIELENHGRYTLLKPGDSLTYKVRWHMSLLPVGISKKVGSKALIEQVEQLIQEDKNK